jgi:signal transduction histidine kinase
MGEFAGPRSLRQLLDAVLTVGSDLDLPAMLQRIVQSAVDLVEARYGALGVLDDSRTRLAQFITVGIDDAGHAAIGDLPEGHGILGLLIVDARPLLLPDLREQPESHGFPPNHPPMRSFLGVPVRMRDEVFGNLYLTDKTSGEVFTDVDEELVLGLAAAAGVAIENARLHARIQELALVDDRERIARDLHDSIIQRLFATGLSLQGTATLVRHDPAAVERRVNDAVDDLDLVVRHIRSTIFGLEVRGTTASNGVRSRVLDVAREAGETLGFEPRVVFEGPLDARCPDQIAGELLATLREALSNVTRHAAASGVDVRVGRGRRTGHDRRRRRHRRLEHRAVRRPRPRQHVGTCEQAGGIVRHPPRGADRHRRGLAGSPARLALQVTDPTPGVGGRHDEDGDRRVAHDIQRDAPELHAAQARAPMGRHDGRCARALARGPDDALADVVGHNDP